MLQDFRSELVEKDLLGEDIISAAAASGQEGDLLLREQFAETYSVWKLAPDKLTPEAKYFFERHLNPEGGQQNAK